MPLPDRNKILRNWPLAVTLGYMGSLIVIKPLLEIAGIDSVEIHYRLFIIFFFSLCTLSGLLWTILPAQWAVLGLFSLNTVFYHLRKKRSLFQSSLISSLVTFLILFFIGQYTKL